MSRHRSRRSALARRWRRSYARVLRSITGEPFASRSERRLLIHCCHHKVGTVWFQHVLRAIAAAYEMRYFTGKQPMPPPNTDIWVQHHSRIDQSRLPAFRGTHMIRDPRDMIVSGYFYHQRTRERWANQPRRSLEGRSFRETLAAVSKEQGLIVEMDRARRGSMKAIAEWDYGNPAFLELRYEDFIADEQAQFERMFRHYGFSEKAVARSVKVAMRYSRSRLSPERRASGHIRSGEPGEWRTHFTPEVKAAFLDSYGDILIRLGYERDDDW